MDYWIIIVSDSFFGVTSYFKKVCKASMPYIMAKSTKDDCKKFERIQNLPNFGCLRQDIASVHDCIKV